MSFAASLVLMAQSAAPISAIPATPAARSPSAPIAVQARATVRVLAPERIAAVLESGPEEQANAPAKRIQRSRDDAGTIWIEFS